MPTEAPFRRFGGIILDVRVVEEPFLTKDLILSILRPAEVTTDRPFRTLRQHKSASPGIVVHLRMDGGRMAGRLTLYSSLNADAARAYRLQEFDAAKELATQAVKLERSQWAKRIQRTIMELSARVPADPLSKEAPPSLRHYSTTCRHATWRGLDHGSLVRDWLAQSRSWLNEAHDERSALVDAVEALSRKAEEVRTKVLAEEKCTVTTFQGVVQRLDVSVAEIENEAGEAMLVQREDLERQGLAMLGQAVALFQEALPSGGSYTLAMPAALLEPPALDDPPSPYSSFGDQGGIILTALSSRDLSWIERELSREPSAVLATPLRLD